MSTYDKISPTYPNAVVSRAIRHPQFLPTHILAGGGKSKMFAPYGIKALDDCALTDLGINTSMNCINEVLHRAEDEFKALYNIGLTHPYSIGQFPTPVLISAAKEQGAYSLLGCDVDKLPSHVYNDWVWALGNKDGPMTIINQPNSAEDCILLSQMYLGDIEGATHLYSISGDTQSDGSGLVHTSSSLVRLGKINKAFEQLYPGKLRQILDANIGKVAGGIDGIEALREGLIVPEGRLEYNHTKYRAFTREKMQGILSGDYAHPSEATLASSQNMGTYPLILDVKDPQSMSDFEAYNIRALCLGRPLASRSQYLSSRVEVGSPLPSQLHPFHPDSQGKIPKHITNGMIGKAPYAQSIGCELLVNNEVKKATDAAEESFHKELGNGKVFGLAEVQGIPYSLFLAREKLKAATKVLSSDQQAESYFTTDSAYQVEIPGHGAVTIHKPKNEKDREEVARFMYQMSLSGTATLSSITGIARHDEQTNNDEYFSVKQVLGTVQPFDMVQFIYKMREQPYISMGLPSYQSVGFLTKEKDMIETKITRYLERGNEIDMGGPIPEGQLVPVDEKTIEMSGNSDWWLQLGGLGFIPR